MSTLLAVNDAAVASIGLPAAEREDWIIRQALVLLEKRIFQHRGPSLLSPTDVRQYLKLKLVGEENEVFAVVFLDNQHRVIAFETLFKGTIDAAIVYPRVVIKRGIELGAVALIFSHNHPSGCTEASGADRALTTRLKDALAYVDIRVLDHIIVGQGACFSFAEAGWL